MDFDLNIVSQFITTIGFPSAVLIYSLWYIKYREDKNDAQVDKLNQQHAEEMDKLTEALNNNTVAITRLTDKLGGQQNGLNN